MKRIKGFLIKVLGLNESMHKVHIRQKVLETQLDYLIKNSNRKMRKKWGRMITRTGSKFYIGNIYKE